MPSALPTVSQYSYCTPIKNVVPPMTTIDFKPCITISGVYDGTSVATRSVQGSACPATKSHLNELLTCKITSVSSRPNGAGVVDQVTMDLNWDFAVVATSPISEGDVAVVSITYLESDTLTLNVATSPTGAHTPTSSLSEYYSGSFIG
jgi:hypothetical protein